MNIQRKIQRLRKEKGWSQQQLADRLGITRQAVSKWESGQSLPDIQMIVTLSDVFEVTTDSLLKDNEEDRDRSFSEPFVSEEPPSVQETEKVDEETQKMPVQLDLRKRESVLKSSSEESSFDFRLKDDRGQPEKFFDTLDPETAEDFIKTGKWDAFETALGVFFCIISPVCLILGTNYYGFLGAILNPFIPDVLPVKITESLIIGLGVSILLIFVAMAVTLFIHSSNRMKRFRFIEKGEFSLPASVRENIEKRYQDYQKIRQVFLIAGVCCCILCPVPLFLSIALFSYWETAVITAVAVLLVIVGVGVFCLVWSSMTGKIYECLLQICDFSPDNRAIEKRKSHYWTIVTAIYLLISFISGSWGKTWLIFPLAGILWPVVDVFLTKETR